MEEGRRDGVLGVRHFLSTFHFRPSVYFLLSLLCLVSSFFNAGCATLNTATGRREFIFISTESEVGMGQSFNLQLMQQNPVSRDKAKIERIERIGSRLAQVSDRQDYEYRFVLIDKDEMNAFTIPGGYIYFYDGLYNKMTSDDQIASVLAHEIGHCAARHTVKKFQAALGYDFAARLVLSRISNDVARQLASLGGGFIASVAMSAYGRQDELEADRLGIKYMRLAGYKLDAMIQTFEILKANSKGPEPPTFLRTHPHLDDRINAVDKVIHDGGDKY